MNVNVLLGVLVLSLFVVSGCNIYETLYVQPEDSEEDNNDVTVVIERRRRF